jgi:hypothetical protein
MIINEMNPNILSNAEYNPFFIKKTFNLPEYKPKEKKRIIVDYDYLFYELFNTMKRDVTNIGIIDSKFNEKQEKFKIAAEIEKMKLDIKSKDKEAIIQNLMYENKINLKTLNALCLFYKINLLYVKDNIFITMYNQIDTTSRYNMLNNKMVDDIVDITTKYEVDLDKPIRCASYYKIDDLRVISKQLHLPTENVKKQQLYDSIHNVLSKLNI